MWYLVISKPVAPQEQIQQHVGEHSAWLKQHHDAGNIVASGPSPDGPSGIWVLRANSREDAKKLADAHPYHAKGLRSYEMYEWNVHQFMGQGAFTPEAVTALQRQRS